MYLLKYTRVLCIPTRDAGTYRRKVKRDLLPSAVSPATTSTVDLLKAQEMILKEMGPDACVYEKVCAAYAEATALAKKNHNVKDSKDRMDWEKIIRYVEPLFV